MKIVPLNICIGVLSVVLQVSMLVNPEVGVILGSLLKRFFTSGAGVLTTTGVIGVLTTTGITTPLSQTKFFPDLIHVYFLPAAVVVVPALVHLLPAFGAVAYRGKESESSKIIASARRNFLCIIQA